MRKRYNYKDNYGGVEEDLSLVSIGLFAAICLFFIFIFIMAIQC